jgi:hypothetical protein
LKRFVGIGFADWNVRVFGPLWRFLDRRRRRFGKLA